MKNLKKYSLRWVTPLLFASVLIACSASPRIVEVKTEVPVPVLVRCRLGSPPLPIAEIKTKKCEWGACYSLLDAARLGQYISKLQRYARDAYVRCAEKAEKVPDDGPVAGTPPSYNP